VLPRTRVGPARTRLQVKVWLAGAVFIVAQILISLVALDISWAGHLGGFAADVLFALTIGRRAAES